MVVYKVNSGMISRLFVCESSMSVLKSVPIKYGLVEFDQLCWILILFYGMIIAQFVVLYSNNYYLLSLRFVTLFKAHIYALLWQIWFK